nr:hypothetical protein Y11D7A.15 - Caenorhabditis elegans [Caenorhabditis elegans]
MQIFSRLSQEHTIQIIKLLLELMETYSKRKEKLLMLLVELPLLPVLQNREVLEWLPPTISTTKHLLELETIVSTRKKVRNQLLVVRLQVLQKPVVLEWLQLMIRTIRHWLELETIASRRSDLSQLVQTEKSVELRNDVAN